MNELRIVSLGNNNINSVYKLTFNNNDYVLRISKYNNVFESKVLERLKEENINCPTIRENFFLDDQYIMICDHINGCCPKQIDTITIEKLLFEVKKLHSVKFECTSSENTNCENVDKLKEYYKVAMNSIYLSKEKEFISECIKGIEDSLNFKELPTCIVHSDIKNENIIVNENNLYLIDFGNSYIGNRLIDIMRVIMWFFIRYDNYDLKKIRKVVNKYFDENNKMTPEELYNIDKLLEFCLLYNLIKDIYLFENGALKREYIESCSLKWLETLKDNKKLENILEVFKKC